MAKLRDMYQAEDGTLTLLIELDDGTEREFTGCVPTGCRHEREVVLDDDGHEVIVVEPIHVEKLSDNPEAIPFGWSRLR